MISLHWVALLSLAEATHNVHLPCGLAVVREGGRRGEALWTAPTKERKSPSE